MSKKLAVAVIHGMGKQQKEDDTSLSTPAGSGVTSASLDAFDEDKRWLSMPAGSGETETVFVSEAPMPFSGTGGFGNTRSVVVLAWV